MNNILFRLRQILESVGICPAFKKDENMLEDEKIYEYPKFREYLHSTEEDKQEVKEK